MKSFVIVNRMGGLGNQLFQYAAARAVAHLHPDTRIYVEHETHNSHNHKKYNYAIIFMKYANEDPNMITQNEYRQESSFAPWHPKNVQLPVKLCGYFQYLPALQEVLPDLIQEFKKPLVPIFNLKTEPLKSMFIHVRRGDYLNLPDFHYIQTTKYYENAFQLWRKSYFDEEFYVYIVSDDPDWCKQQTWSFPYTLYENNDEVLTLALMSQCQGGAIIANSSFSYWGATLSETERVFYPERWIAETVHDLFPSHWVCVSG